MALLSPGGFSFSTMSVLSPGGYSFPTVAYSFLYSSSLHFLDLRLKMLDMFGELRHLSLELSLVLKLALKSLDLLLECRDNSCVSLECRCRLLGLILRCPCQLSFNLCHDLLLKLRLESAHSQTGACDLILQSSTTCSVPQ